MIAPITGRGHKFYGVRVCIDCKDERPVRTRASAASKRCAPCANRNRQPRRGVDNPVRTCECGHVEPRFT